MTDKMKNQLKAITGGNNDAFEQLLVVLNLPNEIFDENYEGLKGSFDDLYKNEILQKEILDVIAINPDFDIEEEKANIEVIIEELKKDDELSENKKDFLETVIRKSTEVLFNMKENPRIKVKVKIQKLNENAKLPAYANPSDAGADIFALEDTTIKANTTELIRTGIAVSMPAGYMIQIYPRSGLSYKTPLRVANSVGIVDHLYNKEIKVILENTGNEDYTIKAGDKIAQMLIMPTPMIIWEEVDNIEDSGRGGFGSTGR